jgi:FlaA1/EpsC-like NDP-sugar epimerase
MNKQSGSEDVLRFTAIDDNKQQSARVEKKWPRRQFWLYRWGLVAHDLVMACCGLWICQLLLGLPFVAVGAASYLMVPLLASLFLSFFSVFELYSYHLIFSKPKHRAAFARAIGWSSLTIVLMTGQFAFAFLAAEQPLLTLFLLGAGLGWVAWIIFFRRQSLHCLFRSLGNQLNRCVSDLVDL